MACSCFNEVIIQSYISDESFMDLFWLHFKHFKEFSQSLIFFQEGPLLLINFTKPNQNSARIQRQKAIRHFFKQKI